MDNNSPDPIPDPVTDQEANLGQQVSELPPGDRSIEEEKREAIEADKAAAPDAEVPPDAGLSEPTGKTPGGGVFSTLR